MRHTVPYNSIQDAFERVQHLRGGGSVRHGHAQSIQLSGQFCRSES